MESGIETSQLLSLMRSAAAIVEASDLDSLLAEVIHTAVDATGARFGALGVIGDSGHLSEFHHRGIDSQTAAKIGHLPVGKGLLGTIIRTGQPLCIDEITDHPDSVGFPPHHPPMGSFLGVPITAGDQIFGNLYLTEKPGGFTEHDESLTMSLAVLAGSAVYTTRLNDRLNELAVLDERERIARDIHDSIIQDLFAMGLGLQGLSMRVDPPIDSTLRTNVERIDELIGRLRSLIFDLAHSDLHETSARASMSALLRQLAAPFTALVRLNMEIENLPDDRHLDDVRHIVKEATSNALRHSKGEAITVDIDSFDQQLIVSVADDGVGFDPELVSRGLGLGNLEARVDRLGGHLSIRSGAEHGTVVEVTIPL